MNIVLVKCQRGYIGERMGSFTALRIVHLGETQERIEMMINVNLKRCMAKMLCTLVIFCQGIYEKPFRAFKRHLGTY
ncbi:hypothetical protein BMBphi_gp068 [Bacillus phage vB_BthS_BMBphi]|nr:hypothetical protein BMBphi_gp068 [Bacillus phage vB_BthS_BMBphi]